MEQHAHARLHAQCMRAPAHAAGAHIPTGAERADRQPCVHARTRWFVGSSSSRKVGSRNSARASAMRMRQPPENSRVFIVCEHTRAMRQARMTWWARLLARRSCCAAADGVMALPQHKPATGTPSSRQCTHTCMCLLKPRPCRMDAARASVVSLSSASRRSYTSAWQGRQQAVGKGGGRPWQRRQHCCAATRPAAAASLPGQLLLLVLLLQKLSQVMLLPLLLLMLASTALALRPPAAAPVSPCCHRRCSPGVPPPLESSPGLPASPTPPPAAPSPDQPPSPPGEATGSACTRAHTQQAGQHARARAARSALQHRLDDADTHRHTASMRRRGNDARIAKTASPTQLTAHSTTAQQHTAHSQSMTNAPRAPSCRWLLSPCPAGTCLCAPGWAPRAPRAP